ncbi:hypothetical protein JKP88DRAFT_252744 [Tribonema minus]|uniref:Cyclic nucleotide-binding domain-containing protein n=1 Tax=Tribonema minus TaxID=303371 RepID=A0A835ZII8_9STRA|nr:hypothetical protein JKP88DRAFT_252744 [Tribonema minus]
MTLRHRALYYKIGAITSVTPAACIAATQSEAAEAAVVQHVSHVCLIVAVFEVLEALQGTLIFKNATPEEKVLLAHRLRRMAVEDDAYLIREGEDCEPAIFMIAAGRATISVTRELPDGGVQEVDVKDVRYPDYFGEGRCLTNEKAFASVRAKDGLVVYLLLRADMDELVSRRTRALMVRDLKIRRFQMEHVDDLFDVLRADARGMAFLCRFAAEQHMDGDLRFYNEIVGHAERALLSPATHQLRSALSRNTDAFKKLSSDMERRKHMRRIFSTYLHDEPARPALVYTTVQQRTRLLQTMDKAEARLDRDEFLMQADSPISSAADTPQQRSVAPSPAHQHPPARALTACWQQPERSCARSTAVTCRSSSRLPSNAPSTHPDHLVLHATADALLNSHATNASQPACTHMLRRAAVNFCPQSFVHVAAPHVQYSSLAGIKALNTAGTHTTLPHSPQSTLPACPCPQTPPRSLTPKSAPVTPPLTPLLRAAADILEAASDVSSAASVRVSPLHLYPDAAALALAPAPSLCSLFDEVLEQSAIPTIRQGIVPKFIQSRHFDRPFTMSVATAAYRPMRLQQISVAVNSINATNSPAHFKCDSPFRHVTYVTAQPHASLPPTWRPDRFLGAKFPRLESCSRHLSFDLHTAADYENDEVLMTVVRYRRPSLLVRLFGKAIGTAEVLRQRADVIAPRTAVIGVYLPTRHAFTSRVINQGKKPLYELSKLKEVQVYPAAGPRRPLSKCLSEEPESDEGPVRDPLDPPHKSHSPAHRRGTAGGRLEGSADSCSIM